ncbi:MAG: coat protein [Cressdnaviricota sp.]|nr:MAG: coat protein [Cressdnaviricota sp.]
MAITITKKEIRKARKRVSTKKVSEPVKSYIKKAISNEIELKQVATAENANTTASFTSIANGTWTLYAPGGVYELAYIAQDAKSNQRIGDQVKVKSMKVNGFISFPSYLNSDTANVDYAGQTMRVVIFQLKKNATTTLLTAALQAGPLVSTVPEFGSTDDIANWSNIKNLAYVLYDKLFVRDQKAVGMMYDSDLDDYISIIGTDARVVKAHLKPKIAFKWKYDSSSGTPDEQGDIVMYHYYARLGFTSAHVPANPIHYRYGRQINYTDA